MWRAMAGLILAAAVAGSFTCLLPSAIDGDTLRCANMPMSVRLAGIDTPEMPGHCRPGRACTAGDPYAARDHLRGLMRWHLVECVDTGSDRYGRIIGRCSAGGTDLSCAMLGSGLAVPRYGSIDCVGYRPRPGSGLLPTWLTGTSPWLLIGVMWLAFVNLRQWHMAATHWPRRGSFRRFGREAGLAPFLGLALLGGWPAAMRALVRLNAGRQQERLEQAMVVIATLHVGLALGAGLWWLSG